MTSVIEQFGGNLLALQDLVGTLEQAAMVSEERLEQSRELTRQEGEGLPQQFAVVEKVSLDQSARALTEEAQTQLQAAQARTRALLDASQASLSSASGLSQSGLQAASDLQAQLEILGASLETLRNAAENAQNTFEQERDRSVARSTSLNEQLSTARQQVQQMLDSSQETLRNLEQTLARDAENAVPQSFASTLAFLKNELAASVNELSRETEKAVESSFASFRSGALERAGGFAQSMGELQNGLVVLVREGLPAQVSQAVVSQAVPALDQAEPSIARTRRSTLSAANISKEFETYKPIFSAVMPQFEQQLGKEGQPRSLSQRPIPPGTGAPPPVEPFQGSASGEQSQDGKHGLGYRQKSLLDENPDKLGYRQKSLLDENPDKLGYRQKSLLDENPDKLGYRQKSALVENNAKSEDKLGYRDKSALDDDHKDKPETKLGYREKSALDQNEAKKEDKLGYRQESSLKPIEKIAEKPPAGDKDPT